MDYEDMTLDELISLKLAVKAEMKELKDEMRLIDLVYRPLVENTNIDKKIKAAGLEGVVIRPDPAVLKAEGQE